MVNKAVAKKKKVKKNIPLGVAHISSNFNNTIISITDVVELIKLISSGELTDKLARQVLAGVIDKEGSPKSVMEKRGLKVVSDDSALMSAIEAAIAAQPETAERVRGGNIPAAGALIGAVMKSTGGQANAAKVRELLLKHLGQQP